MLTVVAVVVAVVVIVTPGQDTELTVRSTLAGGRRAGIRTAAGAVCGQAVWGPGRDRGRRRVLRRGRARRAIDAVTGIALVALGLRLAAAGRSSGAR